MGEENMKEIPLMEEEEFKGYIGNMLHLVTYEAVRKFKSVRRAIRRGHVSPEGFIYPNRPFNNKANKSKKKGKHSKVLNERKKLIYAQLKHRKTMR